MCRHIALLKLPGQYRERHLIRVERRWSGGTTHRSLNRLVGDNYPRWRLKQQSPETSRADRLHLAEVLGAVLGDQVERHRRHGLEVLPALLVQRIQVVNRLDRLL